MSLHCVLCFIFMQTTFSRMNEPLSIEPGSDNFVFPISGSLSTADSEWPCLDAHRYPQHTLPEAEAVTQVV